MSYFGIVVTYIFISNMILTQFLGLCPFIGVSKNVESAMGMGLAVTFVMSIASLVTWALYHLILMPLGLDYLQTIVFILTIASLVQLVEMVVQKYSPVLYKALGIYLPLITTNCAVMGIALINVKSGYNVLESFTAGFAAGLGFLLAILLMSAIRVQMETERVPRFLKGAPIAFISGGLMAMAFMAFDNALLNNLVG
ncbi:RnfABCDGE type electron transport complex subunit A [Oceanispirochaeta sp.]|jgi:electron transport complex protein RnfA|uniref:electron transport complex protein RnfA n=1 Tax=Oceanispirochaeta sp. TaxID=2035350 RepID=UPI0026093172|nr:RnfABCDGE type electron transport complex subunit A [Oceanispirochaeta sp.]MDA3956178.1 RnfABCDGE type electron transport complex subunit A [Oceanispirochaeta sp.]